MRNYRVEFKDPRDNNIIDIDDVKADLFMVDDAHVTVTFYVEKEYCGMTPVAMYPLLYLVSINSEPAEEGDSE